MNEYRLVVCEKPSVARSIAAVLGAGRRGDGFLSGGGYLVSWCFGHLAELSDADAYDEKFGKWRREDLPILPDSWQYTVARDKQKQMNTLHTLIYQSDSRSGLIAALTEMRGYLDEDEAELRELTDSSLQKLSEITDEDFAELELIPDFDTDE